MHYPMYFLCAKVRGNENKHIYEFFPSYIYCMQFHEQHQIIYSCDGLSGFLFLYVSPIYEAQQLLKDIRHFVTPVYISSILY